MGTGDNFIRALLQIKRSVRNMFCLHYRGRDKLRNFHCCEIFDDGRGTHGKPFHSMPYVLYSYGEDEMFEVNEETEIQH